MPPLLVLPAGMLQSIIDQVNPDDLVNFSVSCKELYGAAERRLDKHQDIEYPDDDKDLTEEELLIKHLGGETVQEVFEEFGSAIDEKLSKTLRYNDKNINIWRQRLKRCTRGAVLCLLLLLLPNLGKLHLIHFEFDGGILEDMLDLIAIGVVLVIGPEEEAGRCQILTPLAALPSLRTINAKSVVCDDTKYPWYIDLDWSYEQHMSGVTVLNLQSSCLSVASFSRLLGGIKGLKSFSYDYHCPERDGAYYGVPVGSIIGILLEQAKASLESVAFTGLPDWHCYGEGDSCSFKDFEVLRKIRMHLAYYLKDQTKYESEHWWCNDKESFDVWYDEIERLVDLYPASVRSIELDRKVDIADISLLLVTLPERKAESVPHLEKIEFMDSYILCDVKNANIAWAHALRKKYRKVGVSLSL